MGSSSSARSVLHPVECDSAGGVCPDGVGTLRALAVDETDGVTALAYTAAGAFALLDRRVWKTGSSFTLATLPVVDASYTFRRFCATELVRGGANLWHVKDLLAMKTWKRSSTTPASQSSTSRRLTPAAIHGSGRGELEHAGGNCFVDQPS
jgi:hypothetical protein